MNDLICISDSFAFGLLEFLCILLAELEDLDSGRLFFITWGPQIFIVAGDGFQLGFYILGW